MFHRTARVLSAASLALCFAAAAVWFASGFAEPYVRWKTAGGVAGVSPRRSVLAAAGGAAFFRTTRFPPGARSIPTVEAGFDQPVPSFDGVAGARRWLGFGYAQERYAGMEIVTAGAPLWAAVAAPAVLPAVRRVRRYRRERRAASVAAAPVAPAA